MRFLFLLLLSSTSYFSFAQVINIETLRQPSDSTTWTGSTSLDIAWIKNTSRIFRISNNFHVQYHDTKNLWLFVSDINFQKLEGSSFVNKGTQHLRYNRKIVSRFTWEAFAQSQYDAISNIDFRGLLGTGPRFKLSRSDKYRMYLGTLVMYEYEKADSSIENRIIESVRGSAYASFSIYPLPNLAIISTSYYQPKLDAFSDYRLSSSTTILVEIFKNLAFKINFNYNFDAVPVSVNIPKAQYELTNGLSYTF